MPMLKRWTADDLLDLPDDGNRYEVVDGALLVTPAPSMRHQRAIGELFKLLSAYLDSGPSGFVLFAPVDVAFSAHRGVQPDLFVIPPVNGRHPVSFEEAGRLLLAVEVLSPSTARADRVTKRMVYREGDVPEYWIVDLDARTIERSTPRDSRVEVLADRLVWKSRGRSDSLRARSGGVVRPCSRRLTP